MRGKVFVRYTAYRTFVSSTEHAREHKVCLERGIRTCAQSNLFRDQRSPLHLIPDRLIAHDPEERYDKDNSTGEERQAKDIGAHSSTRELREAGCHSDGRELSRRVEEGSESEGNDVGSSRSFEFGSIQSSEASIASIVVTNCIVSATSKGGQEMNKVLRECTQHASRRRVSLRPPCHPKADSDDEADSITSTDFSNCSQHERNRIHLSNTMGEVLLVTRYHITVSRK